MALIGSINEQGELQGQINGARYLTGVITNASAVGGQVVGMRGLKGDTGDTGATGADGQDGADGFSPSASVSKVDNVATITITDKDGTTTASVNDGEMNYVTNIVKNTETFDDPPSVYVKSASFTYDGSNYVDLIATPTIGNKKGVCDLDANGKIPISRIPTGYKNLQPDWNEADSTADDFIKNKPTIPTKVSELNNDSGFITTETDPTVPSWAKQASKPSYTFSEIGSKPSTISGYGITDAKISSGTITLGSDSITPLTSFTETDPVFTASDAYGITSSDITDWDNSYDGKVSLDTSAASGTDHDLYAAIVALGWQNDVIE